MLNLGVSNGPRSGHPILSHSHLPVVGPLMAFQTDTAEASSFRDTRRF